MNTSYRERLALAGSLIRSGSSHDLIQSIPILDVLIETDPDCSWALSERGYAKLFSKDFTGAIDDFSKMIERWPANTRGYTLRARVHRDLGDWRKAIEDYAAAISINPNHEYAYRHRGGAKVRIGDYQGAIDDYTESMRHCREDGCTEFLHRGKAKYLAGDSQGAIRDFTEAIRLKGSLFSGSLYRGHIRFENGDVAGSVADFTEAIRVFPQIPNTYRHRAEARGLLGDKMGEEEDLAQYKNLGGKDWPAYKCKWLC